MTREEPGRAWILVVAGQDPTRGAGIDADREAAERFGVEARCIVTARTDQDGLRVRSIGARPVGHWLQEAREALGAGAEGDPGAARGPAALKSGLLPGAGAVRAFAALVEDVTRVRGPLPIVVDPLLAASGGEVFLDERGTEALLDELLPRGPIVTPNLPEAARLTGVPLPELQASPAARVQAAERLLERGARAVLLKGGHAPGPEVRDLVLERAREPVWCIRERRSGRLHGSGCRYATAVAAQLARGLALAEAAAAAGGWLGELLAVRAAR